MEWRQDGSTSQVAHEQVERARPLPGRGLLKAWLAENAYCEEVQVGFKGSQSIACQKKRNTTQNIYCLGNPLANGSMLMGWSLTEKLTKQVRLVRLPGRGLLKAWLAEHACLKAMQVMFGSPLADHQRATGLAG